MSREAIRRWRGLVAITSDGVVAASHAVERVHLETARRPFGVLAMVPVVAPPAAVVHAVHDGTVSAVHALIRVTARAAGATLEVALAAAERARLDDRPALLDTDDDDD